MGNRTGPISLACARISDLRLIRWLVAGVLSLGIGPVFAGTDQPQRVVSINLCTDQLAMMLSAPGQLISVSDLALDARVSALSDQASEYAINYGRAEEIYLMNPDLVLAGRFSPPATIEMLRRLGIKVVLFDPAYSIEDTRKHIGQMGQSLGRPHEAAEMLAQFDQRLAKLSETIQQRPAAALYFANGYTSGDKTLAGQILFAAGYENVAARAGFPDGGNMPMELLVMQNPDLLVSGVPYPGASRSEAILEHPALEIIRQTKQAAQVRDRDWLCGTPFILNAVAELRQKRLQMQKVSE